MNTPHISRQPGISVLYAVEQGINHYISPLPHPLPFFPPGISALDAVEQGINRVELDDAEQYYVGVGGLPNAHGVVECDAAVMDHRRRYGEEGIKKAQPHTFTRSFITSTLTLGTLSYSSITPFTDRHLFLSFN